MNLKTKLNKLLNQKQSDFATLDKELEILKSKQSIERNMSKEVFTLGKIAIDKEIAEATATRQSTRQFIVELQGLQNWA